jgi:RNA polymerase sigma-B factor
VNPKLDPLVKEYCETKNQNLKEEILTNYKPLIEYIAKKLAFNKNDVDDLIQVGCIALIKALDRFKPEMNTEFSTFATPNIIGEIKHYFRDKSKIVKVPRKLQETYSRVKKEIYDAQLEGIQLTVKDIAKKLEIDEEKVIESMEAGQNIKVISLDSPSYRSDNSNSSSEPMLIDQIATSNKEESMLNKETLKQAILRLSTRERRIIYLRFYGGLSQAEIADRLELSQMHISRLLSKSIKHLQEELKRN